MDIRDELSNQVTADQESSEHNWRLYVLFNYTRQELFFSVTREDLGKEQGRVDQLKSHLNKWDRENHAIEIRPVRSTLTHDEALTCRDTYASLYRTELTSYKVIT